jgi:hypothetical protein
MRPEVIDDEEAASKPAAKVDETKAAVGCSRSSGSLKL